MSEYTPGPWMVKPTEVSLIVTGANGQEICELFHPYPIIRDPETEEPYDDSNMLKQAPEYDANGRLVAAAPEMYELLVEVAANPATNYGPKIAALLRRIKEGEAE